MTQEQLAPSADGILAASRAIDPVFINSPLIEQQTANAELGLRLFAKVETLNPIRSFKAAALTGGCRASSLAIIRSFPPRPAISARALLMPAAPAVARW